MASFITNLWNRFCSKQAPLTVMIVGLDNSGKTGLLARIKLASSSSRQASSSGNYLNFSGAKPHRPSTNDAKSFDESYPASQNNEGLLSMQTQEVSPLNNTAKLSGPNRGGENLAPTIGYNYDKIQYRGQTINVLDFSGQSKYRGLWQEFYNCVDAIVFVLDSSDLIRLVVARDELENMLSHPYFSSLQVTMGQSNLTDINDSKLTFQVAQKQLLISQGKLMQSPLDGAEGTNKARRIRKDKELSSPLDGGTRSCKRRRRVPILFLANKADLTNAADTELIAKTLNLSELPQSRHPWHIQATSVQTSQGIQEGFDWLLEELLQQVDGNQATV